QATLPRPSRAPGASPRFVATLGRMTHEILICSLGGLKPASAGFEHTGERPISSAKGYVTPEQVEQALAIQSKLKPHQRGCPARLGVPAGAPDADGDVRAPRAAVKEDG
ncbi:MAG: hypothetical protein L0387_45145, partial [Acidobacteria bacterium]|nr:hypothetical protein [Acidobacteriota bacterium]MCI0718610.1 hypothetical protein [Acidobacteriota bacterium]